MTSSLSPRDEDLLQVKDPRVLKPGQWKCYTQLVDGWLSAQGMREGCTVATSGGTWEDFGTHWLNADHELMVNYMTMPFIGLCILNNQDLASLMAMLSPLRRHAA
jgi:hypothetical protein